MNIRPKIVFVAQTPPPHVGQSIMHKFLIDADWKQVDKIHIRVNLSNKNTQFGTFSFRKLFNVLHVTAQVWKERIRGRIDVLYYPPSGPANRKTFYKDLSLLLFTRFLAAKVVFHFHADRFDLLLPQLNWVELFFARMIYQKPDLCIVIVEPQTQDVKWLLPKKVVIIPNGIEDRFCARKKPGSTKLQILYVGILVAFKGIEHAIYTAGILRDRNCDFKWTFVGGWGSPEFKAVILALILKKGLSEYIEFVGEMVGEEKWHYYEKADILTLPSQNDLMPLCIIEGMMMSLPIITTTLRTLTYLVDEKVNGLLSPPEDPMAMASNILFLYKNKDRAALMGMNARIKFEQRYTINRHLDSMHQAINAIL